MAWDVHTLDGLAKYIVDHSTSYKVLMDSAVKTAPQRTLVRTKQDKQLLGKAIGGYEEEQQDLDKDELVTLREYIRARVWAKRGASHVNASKLFAKRVAERVCSFPISYSEVYGGVKNGFDPEWNYTASQELERARMACLGVNVHIVEQHMKDALVYTFRRCNPYYNDLAEWVVMYKEAYSEVNKWGAGVLFDEENLKNQLKALCEAKSVDFESLNWTKLASAISAKKMPRPALKQQPLPQPPPAPVAPMTEEEEPLIVLTSSNLIACLTDIAKEVLASPLRWDELYAVAHNGKCILGGIDGVFSPANKQFAELCRVNNIQRSGLSATTFQGILCGEYKLEQARKTIPECTGVVNIKLGYPELLERNLEEIFNLIRHPKVVMSESGDLCTVELKNVEVLEHYLGEKGLHKICMQVITDHTWTNNAKSRSVLSNRIYNIGRDRIAELAQVPKDTERKLSRRDMKSAMYSVHYGISAKNLATRLTISEGCAEEMVDKYKNMTMMQFDKVLQDHEHKHDDIADATGAALNSVALSVGLPASMLPGKVHDIEIKPTITQPTGKTPMLNYDGKPVENFVRVFGQEIGPATSNATLLGLVRSIKLQISTYDDLEETGQFAVDAVANLNKGLERVVKELNSKARKVKS